MPSQNPFTHRKNRTISLDPIFQNSIGRDCSLRGNYCAFFLKMLLSVIYSISERREQKRMPENQEREPASIPPITPKNATRMATERIVFSIFTATEQVNMPMTAQIKEIMPSPKLRVEARLPLVIFLPYDVLSKYAFIISLRMIVFVKTIYELELRVFLLRKKSCQIMSDFSFCEAIIAPKMELVNSFLEKS